jgi:hypothetical protein
MRRDRKNGKITHSLAVGCIAAVMLSLATATAMTAELVMLEEDGCGWCQQWNKEIGGVYHKTAEGKLAPLRRVDMHSPLPADLKFLTKGGYTPTFILVDNGREIARLRGYPGEDFFWGLLGEMLKKLPQAAILPNDNKALN